MTVCTCPKVSKVALDKTLPRVLVTSATEEVSACVKVNVVSAKSLRLKLPDPVSPVPPLIVTNPSPICEEAVFAA